MYVAASTPSVAEAVQLLHTKKEDQPFISTDLVPLLPNPILPNLKLRNWVIYDKKYKRCNFGDQNCRFFKQRICSYWHEALGPPPHKQISKPSSSLPPLGQLPALSENLVHFKKVTTSETWWTAAYIDQPSKTVIYTQKVLELSGYISDNGISWFRLKEDALISLRYTVFIRKNESGYNRQPSGGGNHHNQDQHDHRRPSGGGGNHHNHNLSHYQQPRGGYINHNQSQPHYQEPREGQIYYNQYQSHHQRSSGSGYHNNHDHNSSAQR